MPFTNSTPNYGLPQYIATDKPTYLGDANGAYSAIDTRMKANADATAANQNSISLLSARVLANEGNIDNRYTKAESDARYAGEPNQLDNANLLNPVNQRGANSYIGAGVYCIDRWKLWGSYNVVAHTLTYVSGNSVNHAGLNVCALVQRNTLFGVGETVTMSAKVNGTVYTKTITLQSTATSYPMGSFHFIAGVDTSAFFEIAIESSTVVIDWVKLESGSEATPYVPKGYGAELNECLRYFQKFSELFLPPARLINGSIISYSMTFYPMRVSPSVNFISVEVGNLGDLTDKAGINYIQPNSLSIQINNQTTNPTLINTIKMEIELSADL